MMMIMTPSNWLKDSAGQTRMESKKVPASLPHWSRAKKHSARTSRGAKENTSPNRPENINVIFSGQNLDFSICLDQEGNEGE